MFQIAEARRFIEQVRGHRPPDERFEIGDEIQRDQRIAAGGEEVVVEIRTLHIERARPELRDLLTQGRLRALVFARLGFRVQQRGERATIKLAAGKLRQRVER